MVEYNDLVIVILKKIKGGFTFLRSVTSNILGCPYRLNLEIL